MDDTDTQVADLPAQTPETPEPPQGVFSAKPWEEVAPKFKEAFPALDEGEMKRRYEQATLLAQTRAHFNQQGYNPGEFVARRGLPFSSAAIGAMTDSDYTSAKKRFEEGNPQKGDELSIASYERLKRLDAETESTAGGFAASKALQGGAIAGEYFAGMGALRALGLLPQAAAGASLASRAANFAGRAAATTATMPSAILPEWTQKNIEAGRSATDLTGLPSAVAKGLLFNAILEGTGGIANKLLPGGGLARAAGRVPTAAAGGVAAQQVADFAGGMMQYASGLKGDFGAFFEGDWGDAGKRLAAQFVGFAAFAALHEGLAAGRRVLDEAKEEFQKQKGLGYSSEEALRLAYKKLSPQDAYRRASADMHPDRNPGESEAATKATKDLNGAYDDYKAAVKKGDEAGAKAAAGRIDAIHQAWNARPKPQAAQKPSEQAPEATGGEQYHGMTVKRVNAEEYRQQSRSDQELGTAKVHGNVIYLSDEVEPGKDTATVMHQALLEHKAESRGLSDDQAEQLMIAHEHHEGKRGTGAGEGKVVPASVYADGGNGVGRTQTGQVVRLVDGAEVRVKLDPTFVEGGNHQALKYIPKGEIWVEKTLAGKHPREVALTVHHEALESELMRKGASYKKAHQKASLSEFALRSGQQGTMTSQPPPTAAAPAAPHPLDALAKRAQSGRPVSIDEVADAAGLNDREYDLLMEMGKGKRLEEAGQAISLNNRQRAHQIAGDIAEKLGLDRSLSKQVEDAVAEPGLKKDAIKPLEGAAFSEKDMRTDPALKAELKRAKAPRSEEERILQRMNKLGRRIEREARQNGGDLTDEQHERFASESQRLAGELEAARAERGTIEPSPVRREPSGQLQGGNPPLGAAGPQQEDLGQQGAGNPPSRAQAPRNKLRQPGQKGSGRKGQLDIGAIFAAIKGPPKPQPAPVPPSNEPRLKFGLQRTFPALTKLSPRTGAAFARAANAKATLEATKNYMEHALKIAGETIAHMKEDSPKDLLSGAAIMQTRMDLERAAAQQDVARLHQQLNQKIQALIAKNPAITPAEIATALKNEMAAFQEARRHAGTVADLIGKPGSPLQTRADYNRVMGHLGTFLQDARGIWTPKVEGYFTDLTGHPPSGRNQIPGFPVTAIAVDDQGQPLGKGVVRTGNTLANERLRKGGYTKHAELEEDAYDLSLKRMMERTLSQRIPEAMRAVAVRTGVQEGVIKVVKKGEQPPQLWEELMLKPAKGIPELPAGERYFTHPGAKKDITQALNIESTAGEKVGEAISTALGGGTIPGKFLGRLTQITLLTPTELMVHLGGNIPTALFKEGMGFPVSSVGRWLVGMWHAFKGDPQFLEKLMKVAEIGASFEHREGTGLFANHPLDPTYLINKVSTALIDLGQDSMRVMAADAWDRMVASGRKQQSESLKRDFINQILGNYSKNGGNAFLTLLKELHIQPFATAASTFTEQGVRAGYFVGNSPNPTWAKFLLNTALQMAKLAPLFVLGPFLNWKNHGECFPADAPPFAIKTGEGKYVDPLGVFGGRRGYRATGAEALAEGKPERALGDIGHAGIHLVAGPAPDFVKTAMTGSNLQGTQLAAKVSTAKTVTGINKAAQRGSPPANSSQAWENLKAAIINSNSLLKTFFPQTTTEKNKSLSERFQGMIPFGEKGHAPKAKKR
jgi:hypothetical protein